MPSIVEAEIRAFGANGDGLVLIDDKPAYIPHAVPGDRMRLRVGDDRQVEVLDLLSPSPERVSPVCALFGQCGGCSMQTTALPALLDWKTALVRHALERAGFRTLPRVTSVQVPPETRRRIDLAFQRQPGRLVLGLHRRHGDVVDMTECHVVHPALLALLDPLRHVLSSLGAVTGGGDLQINLYSSGPDILLSTDSALAPTDRVKLAAFGRDHRIPRISWKSRRRPEQGFEIVAQQGPVFHAFGAVKLCPPPGGFLQATEQSESAIAQAVLDALPSLNRRDPIVELFAGFGTLTVPMAQKGRVFAYEGHFEAISALKSGAIGQRIETTHRDLTRQPLIAKEFTKARVVVLDPPHAGALIQMDHIARSGVEDIVYVSCNPQALQKDSALLQKAGYEVLSVSVIDQFLWSTEVEAVVSFTKSKKRLSRRQT
ncbi:class I SAM-dependent RNA methyltransferase [Asaia sp. W19]|uniref:class I SAM-dependent RNA methyltransferase n=1 Tax=unclassified Asaia TaxID=2685023 RepID=UPI000F8E7D2D|nr:class I SAM-dependent RNA methyltransferase [Asaia sp. W19]RUT24366.1 class I SAM-dependent RNA methyltransferase [Asaia sp. W19]RUT25630.1 class I SAM-dependent RNA methyltransferase [Asaia sp. W19]